MAFLSNETAIYLDPRYPSAWVHDPPSIAGYILERRAFLLLDADDLRAWMEARILADAPGSVCLLLQGIAPDTIAESAGARCTVRRYLDAGGRVVWIGDIPFYYQGRSTGKSKTWNSSGQQGVLGFYSLGDVGKPVEITPEGKAWGLTQPDVATRPVPAKEVTTALSRSGEEHACSWFKNYNKDHPWSGFVRFRGGAFDCNPYVEKIDDLLRVAFHGIAVPSVNVAAAAPGSGPPVLGIVQDLVDQFSDPLDFYRELIQNSMDAGSNRIDVSLEFHPAAQGPGLAVIRVEDDGDGMDENIIENYLLVLFKSTKEDDLTKIGKFGIGFVSVFAPRPRRVRVYTAKNGQSWRIDFESVKKYERYKVAELRDGTLLEMEKEMTREEYDRFAAASLEKVRHWCKHAETRIYFEDRSAPRTDSGSKPEERPLPDPESKIAPPPPPFQGGAGGGSPPHSEIRNPKSPGPLLINEPFDLPGGSSLRHSEEGTEVVLGFATDPEPFFGFYNRGLTLKEGREARFPGVPFKIKSRYLEHTLTRDDVMKDENYKKAMAIVEGLVKKKLPERLRDEMADLARRVSERAAREEPPPDPDPLAEAWDAREPFLRAVASKKFGRWPVSAWPIFPTCSGAPVSLDEARRAVKAQDGEIFEETHAHRVTRALEKETIPVFVAGPWLEEVLLALPTARRAQASREWFLPELLPPADVPEALSRLIFATREMDGRTAATYADILPADFDYPGSAIQDRSFVVQDEAGALTRARERKRSWLFGWGKKRAFALVNADHPFVRRLAALHKDRPGMAPYLLLKAIHLHDGDVPPGQEAKYSNLAEKLEGRLLERALCLDKEARAVPPPPKGRGGTALGNPKFQAPISE